MSDFKKLSFFEQKLKVPSLIRRLSLRKQKLTSFESEHEILQYLEKACEKYSKNPDYVYKSCIFNENLYLIILKKLTETRTNERRKNIDNQLFAKFRANVLDVIEIINIFNPHKTNVTTIDNNYGKIKTKYTVGQTVYSTEGKYCMNEYDADVNNICSSGIHYFKSVEPAFMFRIFNFVERFKCLHIKTWYDNGALHYDRMYANGKLSGLSKSWYETGRTLDNPCGRTLDNPCGRTLDNPCGQTLDYPCGQIHTKGYFAQNNAVGLWIEWYENGVVNTKTNYVNGKRLGWYSEWDQNGVLRQEGNYVRDIPSGIWTVWDENGDLCRKINHVDIDRISYYFPD